MEKFWKNKKLSEFTTEEWEAICMHCGKCCLIKYSDENNIYFSNGLCSKFNLGECKCSIYKQRLDFENCRKVDIDLLQNEIDLLPPSCAYRILWEGHDLPDYHPLVCGNWDLLHELKKTVKEMPIMTEQERKNILLEEIKNLDVPKSKAQALVKEYLDYFVVEILETYPLSNKKVT